MIIKVCGLREADNIRAVKELPVSMLGFDFRPDSERFVRMISSRAGIIPDYSEQRLREAKAPHGLAREGDGNARVATIGVFSDDMPQNIITRIYNYQLDAVQLDGSETPVMISNLRSSVVPDIAPRLTIIKTIRVTCLDDFQQCRQFVGQADLLRFEMSKELASQMFTGESPLTSSQRGELVGGLLCCDIGPDDVDFVHSLHHPLVAGIELNERFETSPGIKDVDLLSRFIEQIATPFTTHHSSL